MDVGSHSRCSRVPVYILTYSSYAFPLLLVQHFMVRALTFKWKQPEQILRHSQALQKEEIYFYCSINAARGSFTAAKLGLMIRDNSMYALIRSDNGGIERGHRVCNLLFEQASLAIRKKSAHCLGIYAVMSEPRQRVWGCIASSSTSAFSISA